mmetsp:Transcript_32449/g.52558  ORF Transcript_32449/g.52558 Transcript_32449/m.52558 type:complete len:528 (-) Transcript_32449:23-1606(-)
MTEAKKQKYDRQLRLWGEHGQAALESAKVCLINAGACGSEILKNLVLPGIGSFTIVDGKKVDGSDVGNNFFVDSNSIGQSRAKVVTAMLQELNEYVKGSYIEEDAATLIAEKPDAFETFTMVIGTQLDEASSLALASICWQHSVPLLLARAYGLYAYLRIIVPEHKVVESRPESSMDDLRITRPFPDLRAFADQFNLPQLDSTQHSHVPYVVILLKALDAWKRDQGGDLPKTSKEKDAFRTSIKKMARSPHEENFAEAVKSANKSLTAPTVGPEVKLVLNDDEASNLRADSPAFWILARGLREFVESEDEGAGTLPLSGAVPDMTATTDNFIALQKVYAGKAQRDIAAMSAHVGSILQRLNRPVESISAEEIRNFCKNAHNIRCIRYRSLESEHGQDSRKAEQLGKFVDQTEHNGHIYILLRAADRFYAAHNRYPGSFENDLDSDIALFRPFVMSILAKFALSSNPSLDDHMAELCRFGASELHTIGAFLGGVAAQEAIKILSKQFIPLNNTFIYNGVNSTATVLHL